MKSFGRMNTEQSAVQTNEDTLDQEIQTDEIETETKWSQFSNEVQSYGGKTIVYFLLRSEVLQKLLAAAYQGYDQLVRY